MTEQKVFIGACFPDEKSEQEDGARKVARAFHAKDIKHARAKLTFLFVEEYPGASDAAYKFLVCEDMPGMPRPALDVWDETFLYENDWSEELGHPVVRQVESTLVDFESLSKSLKVAVLLKCGTTEITEEMVEEARAFTIDDDGSYDSHIYEAITRTPAILAMYPERILGAIAWIAEKCPLNKKWPEMKAELEKWPKLHADDRKEGAIAPVEEKPRTPSGAAAAGGNKTDRHPDLEHNFDVLALEVACGIIARVMDYDIYAIPQSILNRAKDIVKLKERPFPALYDAMRQAPGILDYSRAMIVYTVKTAPENIEHTPGALVSYLNKTLVETDHANPDPEMVAIACGKASAQPEEKESLNGTETAGDAESSPSADREKDAAPGSTEEPRQGPFYYRNATGEVGRANKLPALERAIAEGHIEIGKEEYLARKNGKHSDPAAAGEHQKTDAQPAVKSLGDGKFSIDGLVGEHPAAAEKAASNEVEKPEIPASVKTAADILEEKKSSEDAARIQIEAAQKSMESQVDVDNLGLWKRTFKTDERFTKQFTQNGGGTSINGTYMTMVATREFGPKGIGWGVDILEERFDNGAPITRTVKGQDGNQAWEVIPDGKGGILTEIHHVMKIKLWYTMPDGKRGEEIAFGSTPYLYNTKYGLSSDGEAAKKSLTDATKKALSALGFSGDIFMGLYDNPEYRQQNKAEFAIKQASENAEDITRMREELDEKLTRIAGTMETAVSVNEVKKVFDTIAREVEVHRKAADAKGDTEHARYLSGRLRRLAQIKDLRIKALTETQDKEEAQEQTA